MSMKFLTELMTSSEYRDYFDGIENINQTFCTLEGIQKQLDSVDSENVIVFYFDLPGKEDHAIRSEAMGIHRIAVTKDTK